ncbi:GntR family transcriptional regulator [Mycolicibacterium sp.]|uniref:GntR family transcriptional regulator n=1 Tax=Mycolicibacterium sp. TaxID=2320850 RepID=UPI003D0E2EA6
MTDLRFTHEIAARRKSAPSTVADLLRDRMIAGELEPGTRLRVEKISESLGVSANTVREALQMLERERLVTQFLNRGIFVSELTADGVRDLYLMRRLIECGILRSADSVPPDALAGLRESVALGEEALATRNWSAAADATTRFHSALVAIARSERVDVTMRQLLAELRLHMAHLESDREIHQQFIAQHRPLLNLIEAHDFAAAADSLERYLHEGEQVSLRLIEETQSG